MGSIPSTTTKPQAVTALREIARKTTEVMHVDSCTIYLLDSGGDMLRLQASTGLARRVLETNIHRIRLPREIGDRDR